MVKVIICRDSWEVYYINGDQKVCEADFTSEEIAHIKQVEEEWFNMQSILGEKHRSSKERTKNDK